MNGQCYFCSAPCTEDDFCEGCDEYICDYCDEVEPFRRNHLPDDHVDESEY